MPNLPAPWTERSVREPRSRQASISIGSSDSEQTALAVAPAGPPPPDAGATVTPLRRTAPAPRNAPGAEPQPAHGALRRRALRDPERRLLGSDHAPEHRRRQRGQGGRPLRRQVRGPAGEHAAAARPAELVEPAGARPQGASRRPRVSE